MNPNHINFFQYIFIIELETNHKKKNNYYGFKQNSQRKHVKIWN